MAAEIGCAVQAQNRRHAAGRRGGGRRHELAALDDELEAGLRREDARDRERRELAERVTGDGDGLDAALEQRHAPRPVGEVEQRLRNARVGEVLGLAETSDRRQLEVRERLGRVEQTVERLELGHRVEHAGALRALAGEDECGANAHAPTLRSGCGRDAP